jgi:hypothetical protein
MGSCDHLRDLAMALGRRIADLVSGEPLAAGSST